jgi:two-component system, NtrC family, response regulator AtoC
MRILLVDDDPTQRELLRGFLTNQNYSTSTAGNGEEAIQMIRNGHFHLVLLDHRMPGRTGDKVLEEIKAINPLVRAIMITAYGDVNTAVAVLKLGADEFLEKPLDLSVLLDKIRNIEQELAIDEDVTAVQEIAEDGPLPLSIIADSPSMKEVLSLARRIAESAWPVIIHGETGTGKELIARLIHMLSRRKDNPFIEVNCAAIPENLFESELFGHEKGAFTGAMNRRRGRFELAHTGTLFLDEIGELPLSLQPKLLRALQEQTITRVGSETDLHLDVRLISASNRNLRQMVEESRFREDLYYRLKVLEVEIPPLRQRKEDIPPLIEYFLDRYSTREVVFSTEALDMLMKYPFQGNVRELEHAVQRTITLARGPVIKVMDLPQEIRCHQDAVGGTLTERMQAMEREIIISALEKKAWVQTHAAEMLGIGERVLRYKITKHNISKPDG